MMRFYINKYDKFIAHGHCLLILIQALTFTMQESREKTGKYSTKGLTDWPCGQDGSGVRNFLRQQGVQCDGYS